MNTVEDRLTQRKGELNEEKYFNNCNIGYVFC